MSSENTSYRTTIAIAFSIVISSVAVFLRLLARRVQKKSLAADDYCIIAGWAFTIGNAVAYLFANEYGNGRHMNAVEPMDLVKYHQTSYASLQLYGLALTLIKLSILFFYRTVFSTPGYCQWTNILGLFVIVWLLVHNLGGAIQCIPVQKAWRVEIPGHCINILNFVIGTHVTNLVLDLIILVLPVHAVLGLQMSKTKKVRVAGIFLLGGLSVIIASIRLVVLVSGSLNDITWLTSLSSWAVVEPALEVLSVCLPTMGPFLHIRTLVINISASVRSVLGPAQKSSHQDGSLNYRTVDGHNQQIAAANQSRWSSTITADRNPNSNQIPPGSIMVTQDIEVIVEPKDGWEERKEESRR